ncbi:MAG TPA: CHAT domain-containing tetratricopeptide repeat protein [Blastocatellia bacterium]|nr:CHAT domain-containing tetratricopeptide repeat protein [Blastocatellia bacterium]
MARPVSLRLAQRTHCFVAVRSRLAIFISLLLIQIPISPAVRCAAAGYPAQEERVDQPLEPGRPIERELSGGQSQAYRLTPAAGNYVKVVIDQRGIDVVAALFDLDGQPMLEVDLESRARGSETVEMVAEAAGDYRLTVRPRLQRAAAGHYEIRIEELRTATEDDRALHEARRFYAQALKLRGEGKSEEAVPLAIRALEIREKRLGLEHPEVARSLNLLGTLYHAQPDYAKAEPIYQRALEIREKALGPEHPEVAQSLTNLAILYNDKFDYAKSESLDRRALEIREKALGPEHPALALSLNNLAVLYLEQEEYAKAEPFFQRALSIREKAFGPEHPEVARTLNNLANLYGARGEYARAEEIYQRALTICEKTGGPESPGVGLALDNLVNLYLDQGDHLKAEPLAKRALAVNEKTLGAEQPELAFSLNHLANIYKEKGDYAGAEPLLQRALRIREKALGPDHPSIAISLHFLANLYQSQGDYARAERLARRALAIRERTFGPENPRVAASLSQLAVLFGAAGNFAQAISFQARANAIGERNLALNLAIGSERQKLAYLVTLSDETDYTLSLQSQAVPNHPEALDLAFTTVLRRKGRGLDAMTDTVARLRRRAAPEDRQLFDQLAEARRRLATLTLKDSGSDGPETYRTRLKPLEEKVEELESALSERSQQFRAQRQPVTLAAVQAALTAASALVEFVVFRPQDLKTEKRQPARYLAYLLAAEGPPKWVDLGEAAPIDRLIDTWRKALRNPARTDVKQLGRAVDEKVMRPVRASLRSILRVKAGDSPHLLIAPDGLLNLAPFAALVDEQNRYLVERYEISYLTSGRDLLQAPASRPDRNAPLIVANPAFGRAATAVVQTTQTAATSEAGQPVRVKPDPAQILFQPLPGTQGEAEAIKSVLPEARMLIWDRATETAIKQTSAPRILHIATHGFFLGDQEAPSEKTRLGSGQDPLPMTDLRLSKWAAHIEDPLLRSGLALAGVNQGQSGDDDGVLTALEVAGLDLWGTQLVVLSACDTGVGEVKNGDGVHGLRRALVLAGSETQVMSLWPVSDRVTRELMVAYYNGLEQGHGRGQALRRVQLEMLKNVKKHHPFYWAAFIQSGEWANLEGRREPPLRGR